MKDFGAQNMVSSLKKVLMKKPQKFMSKIDLKKWNYASPLNQKFITDNYNDFYEIIENSGAEIIELNLEDENEELCDSIFTHDPSLVLNEGVVILNMGKKLRKKETDEHDIKKLLKRMIKQRSESIDVYKKSSRNDLLEIEQGEVNVLSEYLPKQLGEEETRKLCSEIIEKTEASSIKDMGKVMGELKKKHSDDIDFSKAGSILKEMLNKQ